MLVKQQVLTILEENRGKHISGEEMAKRLDVSRSAVWKAILTLKKEGYKIEAVTNKGYRLLEETDLLSKQGIELYLKARLDKLDVRVYKSVASTNQQAKLLAWKEEEENSRQNIVVLAENQTKGKGRMGRSFYSPEGSGLYMSILLHPELEAANAVLITTAAAVAVCRAIRRLTDKEPLIKWVNDVFLYGKKICGILTEAVTNFESGEMDIAVVGIGVNVKEPEGDFPEEVNKVARSLFLKGESVVKKNNGVMTRNELAAEILNHFFEIYNNLPNRDFLLDYKEWSLVLGKNICFMEDNQWYTAKALDIDSDGGLEVELEDGTVRLLKTGEISLRLRE